MTKHAGAVKFWHGHLRNISASFFFNMNSRELPTNYL